MTAVLSNKSSFDQQQKKSMKNNGGERQTFQHEIGNSDPQSALRQEEWESALPAAKQ